MNTSSRKLVAMLVTSCFGLSWAASSLAQSQSKPVTPTQAVEAAQSGRDMRASKLIGQEVRNANGEKMGEIRDLIVDVAAERVHYAVLAFGGVLGLGEKLFAYPISSFKPTGDKYELVLNVDKEKMKNAPGFDRKHWPDFADSLYLSEVDRYFRANAVGAAPADERLMRISELIDRKVSDRQGHNAGAIKDLVINPAAERISYAVLDFDKPWSPDDKLVALPLGVFGFPERHDRPVVLDMSRDEVNVARGFEENAWPDLNAPAYRRDMEAYLSRFRTEQTARPSRGTAGPESSSGGSR